MLGFDLRCTNMTIIISQICVLYVQCISTHWIEQKHAKQRATFIFILVAFHIKKNDQIKGRWEKKSFNQHHVYTWKINVLVNNRESLYWNKKNPCISLYTNKKRVKLFFKKTRKTRKSLTKALWIFHFQQLKQCDKFNRKKTKQCHIEKKMLEFKSIPLLMCKSFIHITNRCYW